MVLDKIQYLVPMLLRENQVKVFFAFTLTRSCLRKKGLNCLLECDFER
jgi:hypothetical protein